MFWTNTIGGDFTNNTLWMGGAAPGIGDNANFTNQGAREITWTINATNANVVFSAPVNTYTQAMGSSTWTVTNQYLLAASGTDTSTLHFTSGTLVVTNNTGTASLVSGSATGNGELILRGGTLVADHVYVTNENNRNFFSANFGAATILGDSVITNSSATFGIGSTAGQSMTLNIRGGGTADTEYKHHHRCCGRGHGDCECLWEFHGMDQ